MSISQYYVRRSLPAWQQASSEEHKHILSSIHQFREEAAMYRTRRHSFQNSKLAVVSALVGLGGLKIAVFGLESPLSLTATLFFAPFIAATYDIFIFAEDYKAHRAISFLRHHLRKLQRTLGGADPTGLYREWEAWHLTYKESDARYYGSAFISIVAMVPAILASLMYFYTNWEEVCIFIATDCILTVNKMNIERVLFLLWFLIALLFIAWAFAGSKRRYNLMVEDPDDIHCPVGGAARRLWGWFRWHFGPREFVLILPWDGRSNLPPKERIPRIVRREIGSIALYQQRQVELNGEKLTQKAITKWGKIDHRHLIPSDEEGKFWIVPPDSMDDVEIVSELSDDEAYMSKAEMERPWYVKGPLFEAARKYSDDEKVEIARRDGDRTPFLLRRRWTLGRLRRRYVRSEGLMHHGVWIVLPFGATVIMALVMLSDPTENPGAEDRAVHNPVPVERGAG